ncbi:MAG: hypothetical protein Q7J65_05530, partial [Candidatus Marinimicrobia bacterium]|nr:hypothetical protein [Candidatus Neomarinimicrobiota bacterium]
MRRYSVLFLTLAIIQKIGLTQIQPDEILFIPWNADSMGNVSYSLDPEGRVGPQNFQVNGEIIYLLDQQNRAINVYASDHLIDRLPVTQMTRDFIIQSADEYICLADNGIVVYQNRMPVEQIRQAKPLPIIRKIYLGKGEIIAVNHDGTVSKMVNRRLAKSELRGMPVNEHRYDLKKISRSRAEIVVFNDNGKQSGRIALPIDENNLGSFELIGTDQLGHIFLDVDLILQDIPLKVRREIWIVNKNGVQSGKISVPTHYYAMMWNDMRLAEDGILYHMLSAEDGIHIVKWDISQPSTDFFEGAYPEKYRKYLHYNEAVQSESLEKKSLLSKPTATVTRAEALAIGDTYVVHEWVCRSVNLTGSSGVTAPDNLLIITLSWIRVGDNIRVPYKWGGFSTLPQFDDGLLAGKYAGDRYTSKNSGSSYAVGVDCSGFVSRCWKLSSHYSTRMMDDYIAQAYSTWEDLKPGDAIHKQGHVRLAVDNNPNGTILAVEAAGSSTDWRVDYRTYTYSGLSDYTPRYYINMTGASIPMAQPVLLSTKNDSKAHIIWNLSSVDNVNGIRIQYSGDGINWESMLGDSLLSPAVTEFSRELTNGPTFIRLKSINNESGIVESLPSDTYGYYTPPACAGKVLIVDGFDRTDGSWGMPYHAFAQWMGEILAELKIPFETVANEALISGTVQLLDYQAVYWILGDEGVIDETFSASEQNLVAGYLKSGGQLFVSGSEIAYDLDGNGGTNDKSFFLNYLHADYVQDDANDYTVTGVAGGIFAGLAFEFDDGTAGIY